MRTTKSEQQERLRRIRDQHANAIAREYGLRYVDVIGLLRLMPAAEIRRILEDQGIKRLDQQPARSGE